MTKSEQRLPSKMTQHKLEECLCRVSHRIRPSSTIFPHRFFTDFTFTETANSPSANTRIPLENCMYFKDKRLSWARQGSAYPIQAISHPRHLDLSVSADVYFERGVERELVEKMDFRQISSKISPPPDHSQAARRSNPL